MQGRLCLILLLAVWFTVGAHAHHNVTVDDTDPSIIYTGHWSPSAPNSLDIGGGHTLTENPTDQATFIFTGVAIYFYSPLWPYLVNTAISLDGDPSTLVDLQDHSLPTNTGEAVSETVQSAIVWESSGLANTQHTLVVSVGAGQPYAVVDTLMYTALDSSDLSSSSTTSSTSSSSSSSSTASQTTATIVPTKSNVLPIALGAALGVVALLLAVVIFWICRRKRSSPGPGATTKLETAEGPFPPQDRTIPSTLPVAGLPMRGSIYSEGDHQHEQGYIPGQGQSDVRAREPAPFGYTPIPSMPGVASGAAAHLYGGAPGGYDPYDRGQWTGINHPQPAILTQNHPFRHTDNPSLSSITQSQTTAPNPPLLLANSTLHIVNPNSSMSYLGSDLGAYYRGSNADSSERMSSSMTSASRLESSFLLPPVDSLGKKREVGNDEHSRSTGQASYNQHHYDQKDALRRIHDDESKSRYKDLSLTKGPELPLVGDAQPPAYTPK